MLAGTGYAQQTPAASAPAAKTPAAPAAPTPKAGTKAGTAGAKKVPARRKLVLTNGLWSGKAVFKSGDAPPEPPTDPTLALGDTISFTIKHHVLTGEGTIPVNQSCRMTQAAANAQLRQHGIHGSDASAVDNMTMSSVVDLSKLVHFSGPNSFEATFEDRKVPHRKYEVVVEGTFLSGSSASGSVSVTSDSCNIPTVYTWEASPQPVTETETAAEEAEPPAATTAKAAATETLASRKEKFGYALGMSIGARYSQGLNMQALEVDWDLVAQGMKDAAEGTETRLTEEEAKAALEEMHDELLKLKAAAANESEGRAFLAANKDKEGVVTLPSGLQYKILTAGTGPKPTAHDWVVCNYRGTFINGKEFDSSSKKGRPAKFSVGRVIKGWKEALQLMPVGSKWQLFIPPDLAYGARGEPHAEIAPNSTLIFEVELLSIKNKTKDEKSKDDKGTELKSDKPAEKN